MPEDDEDVFLEVLKIVRSIDRAGDIKGFRELQRHPRLRELMRTADPKEVRNAFFVAMGKAHKESVHPADAKEER